jgi:hypothetical protein
MKIGRRERERETERRETERERERSEGEKLIHLVYAFDFFILFARLFVLRTSIVSELTSWKSKFRGKLAK